MPLLRNHVEAVSDSRLDDMPERTHLLIVLTSMATSNGPELFAIFALARAHLGAARDGKDIFFESFLVFVLKAGWPVERWPEKRSENKGKGGTEVNWKPQ